MSDNMLCVYFVAIAVLYFCVGFAFAAVLFN